MRLIVAILLGVPTVAGAQGPMSVPATVTSISEAAGICGLTKAGVNWSVAAPDTIEITLANAEALPALGENAALKTCFFPWAYEHKVTVAFGLAKAVPQ